MSVKNNSNSGKSITDAITEICLKKPELRSNKRRKALFWQVAAYYSPTLRELLQKDPWLLDKLEMEVPDSDSILRSMRNKQEKGEVPDLTRIPERIEKLGVKTLDGF